MFWRTVLIVFTGILLHRIALAKREKSDPLCQDYSKKLEQTNGPFQHSTSYRIKIPLKTS